MKELSIEEKAKAYDEAKLRMSAAYNSNRCTIGFMNEIFPELKESEDEKIRKEIINYFEHHPNIIVKRERKSDYIAWLEKRGESDETKAKMFLINKGYPIDANGTFPTYEEMYNIIKKGLEKQGELIKDDDEIVSNEDGLIADTIRYKNEKQGEKKPAWSEEDVAMLDSAIAFVEHSAFTTIGKGKNNVIAWLKNLKDKAQPRQWKPSEEQMNALNDVISSRDIKYDVLSELWKDLKKLREE